MMLNKIGNHLLNREFGNCIKCRVNWEAAEDHDCPPYRVADHLNTTLARRCHSDLTAAVGLP